MIYLPETNCRKCDKTIEYKTCTPYYCKECKKIVRKEIWLKNYHKSDKYRKCQNKININKRKHKDKTVSCVICGKILHYKNGIPRYCKPCKNDVRRERFKYRYHNDKTFREKIDAQGKKWAEKNKEKLTKYHRKWRKTESGKKSFKKYQLTDSYKRKVYNRRLKVREMLKNIEHNFTTKEWFVMRNATNGICPRCNTDVGINEIHLDHIYPVSIAYKNFLKTGIKHIYNINGIQPLCKKCNILKTNKIEV